MGNYIGVNQSATSPVNNLRHGVAIFDSDNNQIGSAESLAGNVISGNQSNGVFIGHGALNGEATIILRPERGGSWLNRSSSRCAARASII